MFSLIPLNLEFLNPVEQSLNDFDTSDIVFSRLREEQKADTNIVIVNIGNLDRSEIAKELAIVNSYKPKVIGIDAFFWKRKNLHADSLLAKSIAGCNNIVLVSKLGNYDKETNSYDTVFNSVNYLEGKAYTGYANLPGNGIDNSITVRDFKPDVRYKNLSYDAFSVKVAQLYDNKDAKYLLKRADNTEIINYRGNEDKFYFLNTGEVENPKINLSFLKGKIVLFGFAGTGIGPKILEDIFYTPLNKKYVGKTVPDMYGIFIHANIISMIINKNYIDSMPVWLNIILAIIICYFNVLIIKFIKLKYGDWFDLFTLLLIAVESIFFLFLSLEIFLHLQLKISLTLTLISLVLISDAIDVYDNLSIKVVKTFNKLKKL